MERPWWSWSAPASRPASWRDSREALAKVKEVTEKTLPDAGAKGVRIGYAGDLVTGLYEYGAILDDLVSVGTTGVALILGIIFIYYRRFRVLVPMAVTMFAGLTLTFGLTRLVIGHLNVITGFLVSIIAGNGINFGILYVARFLEERRRGSDLETAIKQAHLATWVGTLTAALAAAAAYGSLAVTQFHGFKHFAFIGTSGMLLCWLATYFLAPAVLVLQDRRWPITGSGTGRNWFQRWRQKTSAYERPFVFLVSRAPRTMAVLSLVLTAAGAVAFGLWLRADPIDYDMRHMQNDLGGGKELYRVAARAADVLGNNTESGMVVLANTPDEVPDLKRVLEERRDSAPPELKPFEGVHSLQDFVPPDQEAKIPLLEEIRPEDPQGAPAGGRLGRGLEGDEGAAPAGEPQAVQHRRPSGGPRPSVLRGGRDARPAALHHPHQRQGRQRPALPAALGGQLPADEAAQRRRHPRVRPGGHLRRHPRRGPQRHSQGGSRVALADRPHGVPGLRGGGRRWRWWARCGGAVLAEPSALSAASRSLLQLRRPSHHLRNRR